MRRSRSRKLGLTTEEYVEITGGDPDFVKIVQRDSDVKHHVDKLLRRAREAAQQVLKDAGLPSEIPDALYLDAERIPANAELARRILSNINASSLFLQSENQIRSFIAGFELAEWQRLLLMNLEYEAPVRGKEKSQMNLKRKESMVSKEDAQAAYAKHGTQKAAADKLGITPRYLRKILQRSK